jgi:hypothetical protein
MVPEFKETGDVKHSQTPHTNYHTLNMMQKVKWITCQTRNFTLMLDAIGDSVCCVPQWAMIGFKLIARGL